jgi:hypothetical protein
VGYCGFVEVQQESGRFSTVTIDNLALTDRSADEVDSPVLQPLVIRPELLEFSSLIVPDVRAMSVNVVGAGPFRREALVVASTMSVRGEAVGAVASSILY